MEFLSRSIKWRNNSWTAHIANIVTLLNMSAGWCSIIAIGHGQFQWAIYCIVAAAFFDGVDGKLARFYGTTSTFGEALDSLSDIISFGVAPAFLFYATFSFEAPIAAACFSLMYLITGVIRLARFSETGHTSFYIGLPITGAALLFVIIYMMHSYLSFDVFAFIMFVLSIAMVHNKKWKLFNS